MAVKDFFTEDQKKVIREAIVSAETGTSGEIRVHVDDYCKEDVVEKAAVVFHKLKMDATVLRNGILFYIAVHDHKFAIVGDKGINEKVPDDFWDNIKETMMSLFKQNEFTQGLKEGILMAGEKLKLHFPVKDDDVNELDNEISFGQ